MKDEIKTPEVKPEEIKEVKETKKESSPELPVEEELKDLERKKVELQDKLREKKTKQGIVDIIDHKHCVACKKPMSINQSSDICVRCKPPE